MPSLSFKPELLSKVMSGQKTETRRLSRSGESIANGVLWSRQHSPKPHSFIGIRRLFRVGQSYAVVPGRGKSQVGRALTFERNQSLGELRSAVDRLKAKAAALTFTEMFFDGDSTNDLRQFDGLNKRLTGKQVLEAGVDGSSLTTAMLDKIGRAHV